MQSSYPDHIIDRIERRWQRWLCASARGNPEIGIAVSSVPSDPASVPRISENHVTEMPSNKRGLCRPPVLRRD